MKPLVVIVAMLALTACNTRERVEARLDNRCRSYGFQPGTEGYANCRMQLDLESARAARGGPDLSQQGLQMMRTGRMTPSVTCTPIPGGGMRCE